MRPPGAHSVFRSITSAGIIALVLAGCAGPGAVPTGPRLPPPIGGEPVAEVADTTAAPDSTETQVSPPSAVPPPASKGEVIASAGEWELRGKSLESLAGGDIVEITEPLITHGDAVITALEGYYYRKDGMAELEGSVVFSDPEITGRSERAEYFEKTELLLAHENVTVEADSLEIRGAEGRYDRRQQVIEVSGGVQGRHGDRVFSAQSAVWRRGADVMELRDAVRVDDTTENATLSGELLFYDLATDRVRVTEDPVLLLRNANGPDMRILGTRMVLDPGGNAYVSEEVRVHRGGISVYSDSASFFRDERRAVLLGYPRVEERDGTLTGDTLVLRFDEDEALTRADVFGNAHVRYAPVDSLHAGEESTVHGNTLAMHFGDEGAERVVAVGSAKSSYRPPAHDRGAGTNTASGDTITIYLVEGRVERVTVLGGGEGVYRFGAADSTGADTSAALPDTSAALPDTSAALPDTSAALPDSSAALPDSSAALPDSTGALEGRERVDYAARRIEYDMPQRVVDLYGEARVAYGPLVLTAGRVRFWADRRVLEAEDDPVLVEEGEARTVVGERMDYNLETREGTIDLGRTEAEDGTILADRLRQVSDNQFIARGACYTTCDLAEHGEEPHFHFASRTMRIYMKDKVVARPVVLYIHNIPILPIPFYVFSIRKGRHSGILVPDFNFGLSGAGGPFFRNLGYYWAASEYFDFFFRADYTQDPSRFVGHLDTRYAKRYLMQGELNVAESFGSTQGHDITGAHRMTLGEWNVTGRAEFRNETFRRDEPLGTDFGVRLDRLLTSDVSVSRSFPWGASLSVTARRDEDLDALTNDQGNDVILTETLPSYSFNVGSRPVGRLPDASGQGGRLPFLSNLRYSFNTSGSSVLTKRERTTVSFADTTGGMPPDTSYAVLEDRSSLARHNASLSDSRRLLDAVNVSVGMNATESWVDREFTAADTLKGFARAATWNASLRLGSSAYGTVRGIGPVTAVRHTVEPSATLNYRPSFNGFTFVDTAGVRRNRFPGVAATESRFVGLSLNQRFQAKVRSGETEKRVDLLNWRLDSGYDLVAAQDGERPWDDIRSEVDLHRVLGVNLVFNSTHDPYAHGRFKNFQLTGSFTLAGGLPGTETLPDTSSGFVDEAGWSEAGADLGSHSRDQQQDGLAGGGWNAGFTVSHRGSRTFDNRLDSTTQVNVGGGLQITKNWSVQYTGAWDVEEGQKLNETVSLRRDLHCWEASFTRSDDGRDTAFFFRINVKSLPDVKYEQGARGGTGFEDLERLLP